MAALSPAHRASLEQGSAISAAIGAEMRAWTVTTKAELIELGFNQPSIKPPALALPVFTWADPERPAYSRLRPDLPRSNSKGKAVKYEQPPGQACRMYCLPTARKLIEGLQGMADRPQATLPYVFITEGEKKAAALVSQGLAGLGLPGVWNFKNLDMLRGDWDVIGLKGLAVCIVFDSDAASNAQVLAAEKRLADFLGSLGTTVSVCRLPAGCNGEKVGIDDFFAAGGTVEDLRDLIEQRDTEASSTNTEGKMSVADCLTKMGKELAILWHDPDGLGFATIPLKSGGRDNLPLSDKRFAVWLGGEWYRRTQTAPAKEAMERAINTLSAEAVYEGEKHETAKRIGHSSDAVWVDLCDNARQIIRIDKGGWNFVDDQDCPIRFLRPKGMEALPVPMRAGSLDGLRDLLSVSADGLKIVESFILGAFMPAPGGFPILVASGEQGSGKSFGSRTIRSLVDPARLLLRNAPKNENDLGAALNSGYMLAFDNISKLTESLSDWLCSLATGGGLAKRQLYTDADEHVVTGRRPVLLNGINDVASAPDLAERCLFVEFNRPEDNQRRTEAELLAFLEEQQSSMLGAIFDRVSQALRDRNAGVPGPLPRLADFARWVYAGTPKADRDEMWQVLRANRNFKLLNLIEDDPLASAIRRLVEAEGEVRGLPTSLLAMLNEREGFRDRKDWPDGWPSGAAALGRKVRKIKTNLVAVGIEIKEESRRASGRELILKLLEQGHTQLSLRSSAAMSEPNREAQSDDRRDESAAEVDNDLSSRIGDAANLPDATDESSDGYDGQHAISLGNPMTEATPPTPTLLQAETVEDEKGVWLDL